jgi:hypothetical protein
MMAHIHFRAEAFSDKGLPLSSSGCMPQEPTNGIVNRSGLAYLFLVRDRLSKVRRVLAHRMGEGESSKDRLSAERRSWNMSRIRGKDTAPEKIVRSLLHRMVTAFDCMCGFRSPPHVFD